MGDDRFCPVCGKPIRERAGAWMVDYQGTTYELCSRECRDAFEADPGRYLSKTH